MQIVIIEDEKAAAARLEKMILKILPNSKIIDCLDSVESSIEWLINNRTPDLIFIDVQLADGISFEIFSHVKMDCPIIFTTAFDQYAIDAFKVNAVDYLLKPIKLRELERAVDRAKTRTNPGRLTSLSKALSSNLSPKRILVRLGTSLQVIDFEDAAYFYSKDRTTFLHTFKDRRYPVDWSLDRLESILDGERFFRINRQCIINLKAIAKMHSYSKSRVKIELNPKSEHDTIVSVERSANFKRWLVGDSLK